MLPSRGFFKKNDCPLYEKGLCKRPHCHFRHRKKVASETTPSSNSQGLVSHKNADDSATVRDDVNSGNEEISSKIQDNVDVNDPQRAQAQDSQETDSNQDSLFAKLVNQSNPYKNINRHIPCAYTPTPQTRGVQPKKKSTSTIISVNSVKANEILAKTQGYSVSYSSVNEKQNTSTYVPSQSHVANTSNSNFTQGPSPVQSTNKYSIDTSKDVTSDSYVCNSFPTNCDKPCLISYEPQSTSKSIISNISKNLNEGSTSDYVPSKVTIPESQYLPYTSNTSLPDNYVPSKDNKPQRIQYVPKATTGIPNDVTYKPSDKSSSGETKYQPGSSDLVSDYIPTEKSAIKGESTSGGNGNREWNDLDFISSEIEMMKKLLGEENANENLQQENNTPKTDLTEENDKKNKDKHRNSSSKSSHGSSSGHKSGSRSHSSSKSGHSSSSRSSKHSSHRSSKSSSSSHRHHRSSSSSDKVKSSSDVAEKNSASEDHKKSKSGSSSGSHKNSRHHISHKSHKRAKEKRRSSERGSKDREEKKKRKSVSDDDDAGIAEDRISSEDETSDCEIGSKKRKNSWSDQKREVKLSKNDEDEMFMDLEEDPDTIEKECLEIFNSYSNASKDESTPMNHSSELSTSMTDDYEVLGKKRTAHASAAISDHSVLRQKTMKRANNIKSAQEVMMERYKVVEKAKETTATVPAVQPILGLNRPSVRIAAVSNIQQMLNAKKAIQEKIDQGMKINERTTIAQTVAHGGTRVAHTPATKSTKAMVEKPTIKEGSKQIPIMKRQIYLDKLLLETNQIYPTREESVEEALKLEEEIFRAHSNSFPAYHTAYMSTLIKTKRRISAVKGASSSSGVSRPKMSHSDVLAGGKKNFSVIRTKKVDIGMLSERHIYEELLRCKLTPEELKENSYPIAGKKPGYATCILNMELKYNAHYAHIKKMTGNRRYCIRCSKQYEVDPKTLRQYKEGPETCSYHPGKKKSGGRNSERIYNCCNSSSTEGCATHVRHVTDCNDYENLPNCVRTFPKKHETNPGIFALDCEMVYTRLGYELARVTVVNLKKEIVYDTLVKPKYPVECYNTFYSGIEEKMLDGVKTTLKDVQAVLLTMFSDKTILIGHSLDSDLRALHLIHDTVVDTAVVYKNEKYHPYKYSLKDLCARKISKIIQDNVGGHDSAEDATAALEIMLNHVKEEVSKYDSLESYEADRMT